jgi:hypothetical protein
MGIYTYSWLVRDGEKLEFNRWWKIRV